MQWRISIGAFSSFRGSIGVPAEDLQSRSHASLRLCVLLSSLLLLAGIEPNPASTNHDIAAKLDAVLVEVKESRDQAQKNYTDLAAKLTATMLAYDVQLAALSTRIDGLDSIMATHATVMADVSIQLAALSSGAVASESTVSTTTVATTTPAINDVARKMRLRDEKNGT